MKIPAKMILCYFATVTVMFLILNLLGNRIIEDKMLEEMKLEYSEYARRIADDYVSQFYESDVSLAEIEQNLKIVDSMIDGRIWLVNSKSTIVKVDTRGYYAYSLNDVDENFLDNVINENVTLSGVFTEPMLSCMTPVVNDFSIKAYVIVFTPMRKAEERAVVYMNIQNIVLLVLSGILAAIFAVLYIFSAYPTRKLRKAALEYAKGNYTYPLKVRTHDEFRDLADALNYMVSRIKSVDDYQKKFIANISHDFRSPLTSIKGYAKAIEDGTIPHEAQNKYLDIILFETDRLTKLTSNLLDLNRIDDKGLMLEITSFDINQVIKSTVATFEGTCRQKRIVIELSFSSKQTYVDADMGRIQQVLYNLTDNAIKFSHQGSRVEIETEEKGGKAMIRVRDHGTGIPKDSIKKIWDRFYKSDTSRGKDKKGTGLGLSIVKEVITAHGENINVISTEGVGTEFTFTLPISVM